MYAIVNWAFPTGIEPAHPVPETGALSTELREHHSVLFQSYQIHPLLSTVYETA